MRSMLVVAAMVSSLGCATVGAGQAGVVWRPSNGTDVKPLKEGRHILPPWDRLVVYDLRTQERNEQLDVLAANGLSLTLYTTVHYHVEAADVAVLHREIGPTYYDVLIGPVLRSRARRVVGRYTPEEIYSTKRDLIEWEILEAVDEALQAKHVSVEIVLVRNVQLPAQIQSAIIEKLAEEQKALGMRYVLEHERLEADRKSIEAEGIALFQDAVSAHLTDSLLRWKRIEALDRLAASKNAKVVMLSADSPSVAEAPR